MSAYLLLFFSAVLINNFVLTRFLGLCIFFGVSKNLNASVGMGMAVTSVLTITSALAWVVYNLVLVPLKITFLTTVVFVLLIASFVQLLEMIIHKFAPNLYKMWGIYLLLIATGFRTVLSVPYPQCGKRLFVFDERCPRHRSRRWFRHRYYSHGKLAGKTEACRCAGAASGPRHSLCADRVPVDGVPGIFRHGCCLKEVAF